MGGIQEAMHARASPLHSQRDGDNAEMGIMPLQQATQKIQRTKPTLQGVRNRINVGLEAKEER
jgi:hypothetical protein